MKADSYFEIGSTHLVCQDYALAYADNDFAYAIVSDGCTSSPNTDIGARLLSIIVQDAIKYLHQREINDVIPNEKLFLNKYAITLKELVIKKCLEVKGSLNLPVDIFDATLLVAVIYKTYHPLIFGWGDGNFIIKYKDGIVRTISFSYPRNMPYYLSYQMCFEKDQAYKLEQQDDKVKFTERVYNFPLNDPRIGDRHWRNKDEEIPYTFNFSRYLCENSPEICIPAEIAQITLSSDGLQSFQFDPKSDAYTQNDKIFPLDEIYPGIISYKNPVGEFVSRRMKSLEKENKQKHIIHTDDVSCASIILD